MIHGTSDTLLASQAISIIDQWKNEGGTFLVDLLRMRLREYCPLHIESLSESECEDDSKSNDEMEDTITSSFIGKCFDKCVDSKCSQQDDGSGSELLMP